MRRNLTLGGQSLKSLGWILGMSVEIHGSLLGVILFLSFSARDIWQCFWLLESGVVVYLVSSGQGYC